MHAIMIYGRAGCPQPAVKLPDKKSRVYSSKSAPADFFVLYWAGGENMKIESNMEKTCVTCEHFRQHYIKVGPNFSPILYGHCVYPRLKKRETDTPACMHYKKKKAQ